MLICLILLLFLQLQFMCMADVLNMKIIIKCYYLHYYRTRYKIVTQNNDFIMIVVINLNQCYRLLVGRLLEYLQGFILEVLLIHRNGAS